MELLNLSEHLRDPKYYNRDRDIETALLWNAVKKTLTAHKKEHLFSSIKSIQIRDDTITLCTKKPIINQELSYLQAELLIIIAESISTSSETRKYNTIRFL